MSFLGILGAGAKILGGLGGLFGGGGEKQVSSGENLVSLAGGAREAAEKYGFNPLTLLKAGAGMSGYSTGTPPLASAEILTGGLQGLDDILSGDEERRRAADQLNLDMARLKLEQARSGVAVAPVSATQAVAPSPLGNRPLQVYPSSGAVLVRQGGFNGAGPTVYPAGQGDSRDVAGNASSRLAIGGVTVEPNPAWSDAEYIEQRHGDVASSLYGVGTIAADAWHAAFPYIKPYAGAAFNATHALDGFGRVASASRPLPKLKKPRADYRQWDQSDNPRLFNGGQ